MDTDRKTIGSTLDAMGVTARLGEGDLISSAIVVFSVLVPGEPHPRLSMATTEGLGWIEQTGMLRLAERISSEPPPNQ